MGEQKKCRMRTKNGYLISKNSENLRRKEKIFFSMPQYGISRAITLHCQFKTAAL